MSNSKPRNFLFLLCCLAAVFVWSYYHTLLELFDSWNSDPDYQHGYFVVPIAIAILWRRRADMPEFSGIQWSGLGLIGLAGLLRWVSGRLFIVELDAWSIPLWIGGAVWLVGGFRTLRWAFPAIAFLGFAAPLPASVELSLSVPLQHIAAKGSAFGLQCLGRPAILDGTIVLLGSE